MIHLRSNTASHCSLAIFGQKRRGKLLIHSSFRIVCCNCLHLSEGVDIPSTVEEGA